MTSSSRRFRWALVGSGLLAAAALAVISPSRASDQADSPRTIADPDSDITDVYAFMRPAKVGDGGYATSTHAVLVLNVKPDAKATDRFSPNIDYIFDVRQVGAPEGGIGTPELKKLILKVVCSFSDVDDAGSQLMTCNANGIINTQTFGTVDANPDQDLRIYAGLRSDPAFVDRKAIDDSVAAGAPKFVATGVNSSAGKNVLSIVVEVKVASFVHPNDASAPVDPPILAVAGETRRR